MSGRIIEPNRVVNRSLVALIYILLKDTRSSYVGAASGFLISVTQAVSRRLQ